MAPQRDPTRTTTLRRRYASKLRGAFADINTALRQGVVQNDAFGLRGDALAEAPRDFTFDTDDKKVKAFDRWLKRQQRRDVLSIISRDENQYVRTAYSSGLSHAQRELLKAGIDADMADVEAAFNLPVHRDALQLLYTRNYQQLEGITNAVAQQINQELTQAFAAGENPRDVAERLTDRVDTVGKTRATTLARTETINAHSTATLNRYERAGIDEVGGKAEWSAAMDACDQCAALHGDTYPINEARGLLPAHPNCRCAWIPVTQ